MTRCKTRVASNLAVHVGLNDSLPDDRNDPLTFPIETTRQRTGGFKTSVECDHQEYALVKGQSDRVVEQVEV